MAQTDREALGALYNATGGPNWYEDNNWNTDADLSEWYGVETNNQGRVVGLSLDSNNLQGPIPPELGNLSALQELDLSGPLFDQGGGLSGPIPKELGALSRLEELRLERNNLTGHIPKELGALSKLQELDVGNNKLTGSIPPELGNLGALETLSLGNNELTGPIPPELGGLRELQELWLNQNQLTGSIPPELGELAAVQDLNLSDNQLIGPIPPALGKLAALHTLYLNGNQLSGAIPPELGKLGALQKLDLSRNKLSGPIPSELGNLGALTSLCLANNELTGSIPPELGQLAALKKLDLNGNKLTGPIPPELGNLSALQKLDLRGPLRGGGGLSGTVPPELGNLAALQTLNLMWNRLSGAIPAQLGALNKLALLDLTLNQLSGAIPAQLGALNKLTWLSLSNNQLSGHIPAQLGDLGALESLYLNGNKLDGAIPPELGKLGALQKLDLARNKLSGPIPSELGNLGALKTLNLAFNQLTGIPRATAEGFKAMSTKRVVFSLDNNPWKTPPWGVILGGWDQVTSFYEAVSQSGGELVPRVKVVLVGAVRAGKTTLTRGLVDGEIGEESPHRTRGVDVHIQPWVPDFTPRLEVAIWDFAGHDDYYSTHQLFLTEGALHLLVVNLHKFDGDLLSRGDAVYIWLDSLLCRVPASAVLVVGTHVDAFGDDHGRSAAALQNLKAAITEHLETKRKEWERAQKQIERDRSSQAQPVSTRDDFVSRSSMARSESHPPSLRLCGFAAVSGRSMDDITNLGKTIWEVANDTTMFPDVRQVVPNVWRRVWAVMDALHVGADPDSAVRLEGVPLPIEGRAKQEFVTEENGFEAWRTADRESAAQMGDSEGDSEQLSVALSKQFKAALKLRQREGSILVACGLIHLNPSWINGLLRELVDHRLADPQEAQWWREQLESYSHEHGIRFNRLMEIHNRFAPTGLLTTEYLGFLWRDTLKDVGEVVFGRLVETMAVHDAMFPCGDRVVEGDAEEFMVPARLPGSVAEVSLAKLQEAVSRGTRMQFVIKIYADYVPPAIIAQFLGAVGRSGVGIFRNLVFHTCWSRGVLFQVARQECLIRLGENLAHSEGAEASTESRRFIEINIGGGVNDVVKVGFELKEKVEQLLQERYPGLLFDASMNPTYMDGPGAWQDSVDALQRDLLEKLDQNLKTVLNQILAAVGAQNLGTDEALAKQLSGLKSDIQRDVSLMLDSNVEKIALSVETVVQKALSTFDSSQGDSRATERRILRGVAQDVAFLRWPIPRLVCVLPAPEKGQEPLAEIDRSFEKWSALLDGWVRNGKKAGRGFAKRELRMFFLCPQDMSLAECGRGGQGYEVKELLSWAKKAIPLAKVGLALASIALKVCTGLAIPTVDIKVAFGAKAGGALSDFVEEALGSGIEKMASVAGEGLEGASPAEGPRPQQVRPAPLQGFAYDQLKDICRGFEVDGTVKGKSPFPSFDTAMRLVDRGGLGLEWAWVRAHNIDQFVSS